MSEENLCNCSTPHLSAITNTDVFVMCDGDEAVGIPAIDLADIINEQKAIDLKDEGIYAIQFIDGHESLVKYSPNNEVRLDNHEQILGGRDNDNSPSVSAWGSSESRNFQFDTTPPQGTTHAIISIYAKVGNFQLFIKDESNNMVFASGAIGGGSDDPHHTNHCDGIRVPIRINNSTGKYYFTLRNIQQKDLNILLTGFTTLETIDGSGGYGGGDEDSGDVEVNPVSITYIENDVDTKITTIEWTIDPNMNYNTDDYIVTIDFGGGHIESFNVGGDSKPIQRLEVTWVSYTGLTCAARVDAVNFSSSVVFSNYGSVESEPTNVNLNTTTGS